MYRGGSMSLVMSGLLLRWLLVNLDTNDPGSCRSNELLKLIPAMTLMVVLLSLKERCKQEAVSLLSCCNVMVRALAVLIDRLSSSMLSESRSDLTADTE